MPKATPDAATPRYFLLDMGKEKFGDCLLCLVGGKTILIDGGHPGDFDGQPGSASLPDQIGAILNTEQPYAIDLLVVTHAHLDHIGCLPRMVKESVLDVTTALVADERLGWGKRLNGPDSDALPDSPIAARVVAALREEPRADDFEDDAAIERFLSDAVTLEETYKTMLATLAERGTTIVRYGRDDTAALVEEFKSTGLQILGPTDNHLEICRRAIAASMSDAAADAIDLLNSDTVTSDVELYRRLAADATQDAGVDGSRLGSALNNQSILLAFGSATNRVLLTADMQFSDPAVNGLDEEMTTLREVVKEAGPYKFIKLSHHGSHNGIDEDVREEWRPTRLFAISGGSKDPTHPARDVLTLLKGEQATITWARTDKNGRIEVRPSNAAEPLRIAKGSLNNSTPNPKPPKKPEDIAGPATPGLVITPSEQPTSGPSSGLWSGMLEVTARIPNHLRRVVIAIESEPRAADSSIASGSRASRPHTPVLSTGSGPVALLPKPSDVTTPSGRVIPASAAAAHLGARRALPPLLFVTNVKRLRENIGRAEADEAIGLIEQAEQSYIDVPDPATAFDRVREHLTERHKGVVLIGGYDVLPAQRLDTLPPELRESLDEETDKDADNFIVWSDALYGDRDHDGLPEVAVSRVPDGKSGQLVLNALRANGINLGSERFAICNAKRPFANDVLTRVPGAAAALISLPSTIDHVIGSAASVPLVYFMLHGFDSDATRFAGQEPEFPDAFDIDQVPGNGGGVVFTGCCWGALTVRQIASRVPVGRAVTPRTSEQSIALRYLQAGYNAFVGCTGSHYSPPGNNLSHGMPMHVAFWERLTEGVAPAEALFQAKIQYLSALPHGLDDLWDIAIEHKILRQFTCLGLGW